MLCADLISGLPDRPVTPCFPRPPTSLADRTSRLSDVNRYTGLLLSGCCRRPLLAPMSSSAPHCPRVALIGVSGYGRIHLSLVREAQARGELQLVAAVVINEPEEASLVAELKQAGCTIYGNCEDMFSREAPRLDLCLVPTGIHWHARMTLQALAHGVNVLVEKPLCPTMAEAEAIRQAEVKSGKFVAVGFQDLYEPGTLWLKRELVGGAIGQIKSVRFLGLWPRQRSYFLRNHWAGRLHLDGYPVYDSPLSNACAHFVMLSLFFADPHATKAASLVIEDAELYRAHAIESFDTAVVRSVTTDGVNLWFGASHSGRTTVEPVIEIEGTAGTAGWRYEEEAWWQPKGGPRHPHRLLSAEGARQCMMAAVLQRLRDPGAPVCSTDLAIKHTAFIETLHRSHMIAEFDSELLNWGDSPERPEANPAVRSLSARMQESYALGAQLSSAEFRWAAAGASS